MPAFNDQETTERFGELLTALVDEPEMVEYVDVEDAAGAGWLVPEGEVLVVTFVTAEADEDDERFLVTVQKIV